MSFGAKSYASRPLPVSQQVPERTQMGQPISSVIPSNAKRVAVWASYEGDRFSGMDQLPGDTQVKLGSGERSNRFFVLHGPSKVTRMTEWFDTNGDGKADVSRTTSLNGSTVVRTGIGPTLEPGGFIASDHNRDGLIDRYTEANQNGERSLEDGDYDGRVDRIVEDVRRLSGFRFDGIDNSEIANRILEDANKDGAFDQETVTQRQRR